MNAEFMCLCVRRKHSSQPKSKEYGDCKPLINAAKRLCIVSEATRRYKKTEEKPKQFRIGHKYTRVGLTHQETSRKISRTHDKVPSEQPEFM